MLEALIAFASGVGVALLAAGVGAILRGREERRKRVREAQFRVYMKLLNVWNLYFWVASRELRREEVDANLKRRIRDEAWQIADLLRFEDQVPHTENVLRVLLSNEYPSAAARHDAMNKVLDDLGARVNPRYQRTIKAISEANVLRLGSGQSNILKSTAPGFMEPLL